MASAITLSLVLVLILGPSANKSHATSMFGTLRAPGQEAVIAGHRGDRSVAPENTLPALQGALSGQMLFVETDLRLTKDGAIVLIHDATVDRTTDGSGSVADLTLDQLQQLDAGSWFTRAFSGVRIPTLESFLELLGPSDKKAMLELKGVWSAEGLAALDTMISLHNLERRVVLASFDVSTVSALRVSAPELPRMIISRLLPEDPVAFAHEYGAIGLVTSAESIEADDSVVDAMHHAGMGILLYTLNKEKNWKAALALGVDGIITDKPSKLDEWLAISAPGT